MSNENKPQQPKREPVKPKGSMVSVRSNGRGVDDMIRRFKKKIKDAGVLEEYKNRQYFIKPSMKRRTARNAAIQKQRRDARLNKNTI